MTEFMRSEAKNFTVVLHDKLVELDDQSVFASFETVSLEILETDKIPARHPSEFKKVISPFGKETKATKTQTNLTGISKKCVGFK